ncbi:MAG TPA: O-antigen ligase family protein [Gaiellaceae bacterium]|nr:O-antigen ligase family protein [Gaiellaceae bacterium]
MSSLLSTWARAEPVARALVLVAAALLFLAAAATVQIVYTVTPSLALLGAACVVGAPAVVRGWRRVPAAVALAGAALVAAYALALVLADPVVVADEPRAGLYRGLGYFALLCLGLAVVGLVRGLWDDVEDARSLVVALVVGAAAAAAYALYQWPAQRFGLPFQDVNNTLDSNGFSRGVYQGAGLLGWERVRGTFLEPHFLATYLSSLMPLVVAGAYALSARRRRMVTVVGVGIVAALAVTASAPPVALVVLAAVAATALVAVSRARVRVATLAATACAAAVALAPVALSQPEVVASATGRSTVEVDATTRFRVDTWTRVLRIAEQRPGVGYGPGQASVLLTAHADVAPELRPRKVGALQSAHGVWAAALLDAGVLGLGTLLVFLAAVLGVAAAAAVSRPGAVRLGIVVAAAVAVANAQITGDRLPLEAWVLLGLALLAAPCRATRRDAAGAHG